jgi:hypothetical protein
MLDEIFTAEDLTKIEVDYFYQYQIMDWELQENILKALPDYLKRKFKPGKNLKPWHAIRRHEFRKSGLQLNLSRLGNEYLPDCMSSNNINEDLFHKHFTVGYLWRHRGACDAINPLFQKSKDWVLKTKSELFRRIIEEYDAHILIAGMKKGDDKAISEEIKNKCGFLSGEYKSKYTEYDLDLPKDRCTYLKGLGYAAEMEIMSRCDLLLMMPSGFSEALWMKKKAPVVLLDPPPVYMIKLFWNRMPLFNNLSPYFAFYNTLVPHTSDNVFKFLNKMNLLRKRKDSNPPVV